MRKILSALLSTSVILSALTFGVSAAEVALTANGPTEPIELGDTIEIELGLSSSVDIGAFDIEWDVPSGFTSEEVVLSEALASASFSGSANTEKGLANYFSNSYAETDELVTIVITAPTGAAAWGDYDLTFSLIALNDKDLGEHTITTSTVVVPITIANNCEHTFDEGTVTTAGDCTTDKVTHFVCSECRFEKDEITPAPGHKWDEGVVTVEPTCKDGVKTFTCTVCSETREDPIPATGAHTMENVGEPEYEHPCLPGTQNRKCSECDHTDTVEVPATEEHKFGEDDLCTVCGTPKCIHEWSDWTVTTAPKCTVEGEETRVCGLCNETEKQVVPATGHTENAGKITTPSTCVKEGVKTFNCSVCSEELRTESVAVNPKAHTWSTEGKITTPATCTTDGVKSYSCTNVNGDVTCDQVKTEAVPAYGHEYGDGKITKEPTCTTAGERTFTCVEGDHSYTERVPALGHSYKNSICVNCGEKRPEIILPPPASSSDDDEEDTTPAIVFEDVPEDADYYDAVYWAVDHGITNGMTPTTFGPDFTCTRAQIVTFLWRAAGSPDPVDPYCPFTDVEEGAYYETALLWAIENGITKGTSLTTFSPDVLITKEQFLTFLYRFNGSPDVEIDVDFEDVNTAEYYVPSIAWALDNEIAVADSETVFGIGTPCSRAQSVTYLYLCFGK